MPQGKEENSHHCAKLIRQQFHDLLDSRGINLARNPATPVAYGDVISIADAVIEAVGVEMDIMYEEFKECQH